jgi:predicted exporter
MEAIKLLLFFLKGFLTVVILAVSAIGILAAFGITPWQ